MLPRIRSDYSRNVRQAACRQRSHNSAAVSFPCMPSFIVRPCRKSQTSKCTHRVEPLPGCVFPFKSGNAVRLHCGACGPDAIGKLPAGDLTLQHRLLDGMELLQMLLDFARRPWHAGPRCVLNPCDLGVDVSGASRQPLRPERLQLVEGELPSRSCVRQNGIQLRSHGVRCCGCAGRLYGWSTYCAWE